MVNWHDDPAVPPFADRPVTSNFAPPGVVGIGADDDEPPAPKTAVVIPREEPKPEPTPAPKQVEAPKPVPEPAPAPSSSSSAPIPTTPGGAKFEVTGRSAKGGTAGSSCQFTIKLKLEEMPPAFSSASDLTVHVEGPSQPKINVSGSAGWGYAIGFTPAVEGQYWFDFVHKGTTWTEQPLLFPVEKGKKVPDFAYQGTKRKAANPN